MWQFGLKGLLVGMAVTAGVIGVATQMSPVGWAVASWTAILIAAHVLANAWGSRVAPRQAEALADRRPSAQNGPLPVEARREHRLRHRSSVPRVIWVGAGIGAFAGACGGAYAMWTLGLVAHRVHVLAMGAASTAVIGGLFGFLAGSFLHMTLAALFEAGWGHRSAERQSGEPRYRVPSSEVTGLEAAPSQPMPGGERPEAEFVLPAAILAVDSAT